MTPQRAAATAQAQEIAASFDQMRVLARNRRTCSTSQSEDASQPGSVVVIDGKYVMSRTPIAIMMMTGTIPSRISDEMRSTVAPKSSAVACSRSYILKSGKTNPIVSATNSRGRKDSRPGRKYTTR